MDIEYKRNEDKIVRDLQAYIDATYSQHYVGKQSGSDVLGDWEDAGILRQNCHGNMIKYVKRFGRKEGYNRKDIMKVLHYGVLLLNAMDQEGDQ